MYKLDLGFAETRERASFWLVNRYFPSKLGGRPAWLNLDALPSRQMLQCQQCSKPMSFLCQVYAAYDDEHNFHRMIYIFICRQPTCQEANSARNLLVLRNQLPLKNPFYSERPPDAESIDPEPEIQPKKSMCLVCGCLGPLKCGRCRVANYCSETHQIADWKRFHKRDCGTHKSGETSFQSCFSEFVFPEYEIVMDDEANDDSSSDESKTKPALDDMSIENHSIAEYEKLVAEGKDGTFKHLPEAELSKYVESVDVVGDKQFRIFKKEIAKEPKQILRYARGGSPLWITGVEHTIESQIGIVPNCELCNGPRQFEFQIMPQMLLYLKDDNVDWGVLAVYTCAKSCPIIQTEAYVREYIVKQDIVIKNDSK